MASHQNSTLSVLPVDKTFVFYSPIEGDDVLVRTGTIRDGSCCYHAVLHAYSRDYVRMDKKERARFVRKLRASLASKMDRSRWEKISGGLVAKISYQENVSRLLTDFYDRVTEEDDSELRTASSSSRRIFKKLLRSDDDVSAYRLVAEMVPLRDLQRDVFPAVYDQYAEEPISSGSVALLEAAEAHYRTVFKSLDVSDTDRIEYCVKKLGRLVEMVTDAAEKAAFEEYVDGLKDTVATVDRYTIDLISDRFNRDVYFLDSRTRLPYKEDGSVNFKKRKSIVLMWMGGAHYEVVGRLLSKKVVQREFEHNDPLIERLHMFLCNPEKVPSRYPGLAPYLPESDTPRRRARSSPSPSRTRRTPSPVRSRSPPRTRAVSRSSSSSLSSSSRRSPSPSERKPNRHHSSSSSSDSPRHRSPRRERPRMRKSPNRSPRRERSWMRKSPNR